MRDDVGDYLFSKIGLFLAARKSSAKSSKRTIFLLKGNMQEVQDSYCLATHNVTGNITCFPEHSTIRDTWWNGKAAFDYYNSKNNGCNLGPCFYLKIKTYLRLIAFFITPCYVVSRFYEHGCKVYIRDIFRREEFHNLSVCPYFSGKKWSTFALITLNSKKLWSNEKTTCSRKYYAIVWVILPLLCTFFFWKILYMNILLPSYIPNQHSEHNKVSGQKAVMR